MSDTPSNSAGAEAAGPLQQIYGLIGGRPILLPIPKGEKGPAFPGWQKITWKQSQERGLLTEWRDALPGEAVAVGKKRVPRGPARPYCEVLAERATGGNIGVLLGEPSVLEENGRTWNLCSIDIDDTAAVESFIAENPLIAFTLQTAGARGRNLWLWIEGPYPKLAKGLRWLALDDHESKAEKGGWVKKGDPDPDHPFGEWRATGGQTVFFGKHPSGCDYQWLVRKPPVRITFDEINWPKSVFLPWAKPELPPDEAAIAAENAKKQAELIKQYGRPWDVADNGSITLNQPFFAGLYAGRRRIVYSPEEARFWLYQGDDSGLWAKHTEDKIRTEMAADIKEVADDFDKPDMIMSRTTGLMSAITAMLRGQVEKWDAFKRPISPKTNRPRALVHCQNCMLDLDVTPPVAHTFSADYLSRNQLAVHLKEGTECPRFIEYLRAAVSADDLELMQKFAGQMLIGVNYAQKILILTGTAGGGKSTFVRIIRAIIGEKNVGQLRTEHLGSRFELSMMMGKSLLVGVDVPGKFLQAEFAHKIKGLCGGDPLVAESKHGNDTFEVVGEFNALITCNGRLKVKLDEDSEAWMRRLGIVNFDSPPPARPDPHFVMKLVASEGSGILNWMIEGAAKLLKDIEETGTMQLSTSQKDRVQSLLAESDSVCDFVRRGLTKSPDAKCTTEQLLEAYVHYCEARGWVAEGTKIVERELPDAMLDIHRVSKSNDIKLGTSFDEKAKRGYRGIEILKLDGEETPGA
jgi:P4 family phage/plasmid primase-like protien